MVDEAPCGYCGGVGYCREADVPPCSSCAWEAAQAEIDAFVLIRVAAPRLALPTVIAQDQGHAPGCLALEHGVTNERPTADGRLIICGSCGRIQRTAEAPKKQEAKREKRPASTAARARPARLPTPEPPPPVDLEAIHARRKR